MFASMSVGESGQRGRRDSSETHLCVCLKSSVHPSRRLSVSAATTSTLVCWTRRGLSDATRRSSGTQWDATLACGRDETRRKKTKQAAVLERALRPNVKQENNLLSPVCQVHRKNRRVNNLFILLRDTRASLSLFCKDFFSANRKCKLTSLRMWRAASRSLAPCQCRRN